MSDQLEIAAIPEEAGRTITKRLQPLHALYWRRQGYMSLEELMRSSYLQGFVDALQMEKQIKEREIEPSI